MTMHEKIQGVFGKLISLMLIITTQGMTAHLAYGQSRMSQAIIDANEFAREMSSNRSMPQLDNNGNIIVNGEILTTQREITGQQETDFIPAQTDSFGSDGAILNQGSIARSKYEESTLETAPNAGAKAYHIVKKSFQTQKPDLTNDPMWNNTDNIFDNLTDIASGFANCEIDKELISSGNSYHVPKYETCERLPALEESFTISHDYKVGVIAHESGPVNFSDCGEGCLDMWIGRIGDNYWGGNCTIYEESMSVRVIQPDAIISGLLRYSKFDDYHQVWLNSNKIYNGPNANFPPETAGSCELSKSWSTNPNVNVTSNFRNINEGDVIDFKTRTSVSGNGEGYSGIRVLYDNSRLIYNDVWSTLEQIDKAFTIKQQLDEGFCEGHITCVSMPTLDADGCHTENGVKVCESDFKENPLSVLGISPFCKRVDVVSNCNFNEGEFCSEDMQGVEHCINNDTASRNTCVEFEENPECSFVKSECVEGAEGSAGGCYLQEDTYDCGFTASTGSESEEDVLRCDGAIQCIGESCYSPVRDEPNGDFGEVNAYLEMLKYARADMTCEGIPDAPYNEETPPDRYTPIPTCEDGYTYNKDIDKCLLQTECKFDENNFYAASIRNGIQVVNQSNIIADNDSITNCVPIEHGGVAYTCGNAVQKQETDTFHQICSNEVSPKIAKGCPSEGHTLNPDTGYCEIPPIASCPDGVPLVEGSDPWSVDDDKCLLEVQASLTCSGENETFDEETGLCVSEYQGVPICPSGLSPVDGICQSVSEGCYFDADSYVSDTYFFGPDQVSFAYHDKACVAIFGEGMETAASYFCLDQDPDSVSINAMPEGFWKGDLRIKYKVTQNYPWCGSGVNITRYPASEDYIERPSVGANPLGKKNHAPDTSMCWVNFRDWHYGYEMCTNITVEEQPICNRGILNGDVCEESVTSQPITTCSVEGSTYDPSTDTCRIEEPATVSCPSYYPIWNESEGRCTSDKYDMIRASVAPFKMNNPDSETPNNDVLKPLLETVLSPVAMLFSAAVPSVVADDEEQTNEESEVTKESMNAYIGERFGEIADRMENDQELYEAGTAQLAALAAPQFSNFSSESGAAAPTGRSFTTTSVPPTGGAGTENISCELFKSDAMECKIAVGGMQNCCKNPVAVSLADYISLTRTVLTMDGLTGQVFGIDGYSGAWSMLEEGASNVANSAWESVSGLWSSGADAATGTATTAAGDAAGQGMMHTFGQAIMTYTNDFLVSTFGPEVAAMFFTTSGAGTAAGATIAPSAGLASAGAALMYVYYAYLAYVVFNLLVNIIWACEEEEMDLAMKRDLLSTHYLGSYCKSEVLGACIEKRESYCVFDSPLSRIMMEQIYMQPQMNLRWGSAKNPNCGGLKIEDLDKVNWDAVNLDEWIGILIQTDNYTEMVDIDLDSLTGNGSALSTEEGRMDVLERNQERMDGIDAEKVKREAYEETWNRNQPAAN